MILRRDALLLELAGVNVDALLYLDDDIVTSALLPSQIVCSRRLQVNLKGLSRMQSMLVYDISPNMDSTR